MEWINENWGSIISVTIGILSVASVITKMTPSPKDDAVVAKLLAWVSFLQPRGAGTLKLPSPHLARAPPPTAGQARSATLTDSGLPPRAKVHAVTRREDKVVCPKGDCVRCRDPHNGWRRDPKMEEAGVPVQRALSIRYGSPNIYPHNEAQRPLRCGSGRRGCAACAGAPCSVACGFTESYTLST